jgi:FkbM family methyltransferase
MKDLIKKVLHKAGYQVSRIQPDYSNHSYSQCGEDILIDYVFKLRNITSPTYIDIGANHPKYLNNTYKFYLRECSGINIEPNSQLIEEYKHTRPRDVNLNFGISGSEGELLFYMFEDDTLNTFSKDEADLIIGSGHKLLQEKLIKTYPLSTIIQNYANNNFPDLLTIDVEGLDFEIIQSIDFSTSFPKIMCLETAEYSPIGAGKKREDLMNYVCEKGYSLYADTNLNSIYVKNEFWFI